MPVPLPLLSVVAKGMNRFDRVTAMLLLLQTRTVVTARMLADHFGVTERTVYRDIRTLENAGVPILSEAGVGYSLEKGYHLPPVSFTQDEAASLLLGEKLLATRLDVGSHADFRQALNKVRAVLDRAGKDYLTSLESDIEVSSDGSPFPMSEAEDTSHLQGSAPNQDRWLRECRSVLVHRQCVALAYAAGLSSHANSGMRTRRTIEPIGLFHYRAHWHLIAWCRLREGYRDFRLDRIEQFTPLPEQFPRHSRHSLQQYLSQQREAIDFVPVVVRFDDDVARFVGDSRYEHGFVSEEANGQGVTMTFLCAHPAFMARWLLQYSTSVVVLEGDSVRALMAQLSADLAAHWASQPS